MRSRETLRGFTLIELLVVIAVIALLVGILLPALGSARKESRAVVCSSNIRQVALGVTTYTIDNKDLFPPAYVYADDPERGTWRLDQQLNTHPQPANGYVHWSYSLLTGGDGAIAEEAFRCPGVYNGGAPATNPSNNIADWEPGQVNDVGQSAPGSGTPHDKQAKRMAYTGNAAVFPRNKFNINAQRRNQLVRDARIQFPIRTILATEFLEGPNWQTIADGQVMKSHRPITPFIGGSSGTDVYNEPDLGNTARFFYPAVNDILRRDQLGPAMIRDGNTILNAVGRHHPGAKDAGYGGTANFVFIDGHVERLHVLDTIRKQLWGDQFYSLTGRNTRVEGEF